MFPDGNKTMIEKAIKKLHRQKTIGILSTSLGLFVFFLSLFLVPKIHDTPLPLSILLIPLCISLFIYGPLTAYAAHACAQKLLNHHQTQYSNFFTHTLKTYEDCIEKIVNISVVCFLASFGLILFIYLLVPFYPNLLKKMPSSFHEFADGVEVSSEFNFISTGIFCFGLMIAIWMLYVAYNELKCLIREIRDDFRDDFNHIKN